MTIEDNVTALRPLDEAGALEWLRSQPGASTTLPAAELARRWGWQEHRVRRRVIAWQKSRLIRRRGRVMTAVGAAVIATPNPTPAIASVMAPDIGVGKPIQLADMTGRSLAVRQAAKSAATTSAQASPYIARLADTAGEVARSWPGLGLPLAEQAPSTPIGWSASAGMAARSWPLVIIAYGFFGIGVGINVWNAATGGALTDMALPAALGILAEAVVFFLPAWAMTLPVGRQVLAWGLFAFISVFALTNSLRMASIIAADQATARADRQTEGVQTADRSLEAARGRRDEACGRGLGKTVACQARQAEVTKLEAKQIQATAKVAAQARPEASDFAKLVAWASHGIVQPGADDFAMLWLLFRTFLPQVGGIVLMLARRSA